MGIYGVGGEWGKNTSVCLLTSVSKEKIRNVFPLSLLRNTIMRAPRALRFGGVRGFGGLWNGWGDWVGWPTYWQRPLNTITSSVWGRDVGRITLIDVRSSRQQ